MRLRSRNWAGERHVEIRWRWLLHGEAQTISATVDGRTVRRRTALERRRSFRIDSMHEPDHRRTIGSRKGLSRPAFPPFDPDHRQPYGRRARWRAGLPQASFSSRYIHSGFHGRVRARCGPVNRPGLIPPIRAGAAALGHQARPDRPSKALKRNSTKIARRPPRWRGARDEAIGRPDFEKERGRGATTGLQPSAWPKIAHAHEMSQRQMVIRGRDVAGVHRSTTVGSVFGHDAGRVSCSTLQAPEWANCAGSPHPWRDRPSDLRDEAVALSPYSRGWNQRPHQLFIGLRPHRRQRGKPSITRTLTKRCCSSPGAEQNQG